MDLNDRDLGVALVEMLEAKHGESSRIDLKAMPAAFFDYFEVSELEMAA